jgi:hypothetical protein
VLVPVDVVMRSVHPPSTLEQRLPGLEAVLGCSLSL